MNHITIEQGTKAEHSVLARDDFYHVYLNGEYIDTFTDLSKAEALKAELEQPVGCTDDESEV